MSQKIALEAHSTFGPMTASAVLQVCPSSAVVAEPSSALKFFRLYNPRSWSKDDYSRFAVVAVVLLELLRQISSFFIIPRS